MILGGHVLHVNADAANRRVVLAGQAPSRRSDPSRPLSGRSAAFLSLICGAGAHGLESAFDLENLIPAYPGPKEGKGDRFPLWKGRLGAWAMGRHLRGRRVVFLGQNVARAFGRSDNPILEWRPGPWPLSESAILPHPSGVNRWWNKASNRLLARRFLMRCMP